jgi:hypothetical protein
MQDPMVMQMIGQNPQAKPIMAALQAHIAEHTAFLYRKQIEEKMGVPLPPPNQPLPENIEVQLSALMGEAGRQLTQTHQQQAAQQQAQQKAQDPVVQMQQAELQVKQQEVQRKAQKDQTDAQIKQAELQLKAQKTQADATIDAERLKLEQQELQLDAEKQGAKLAADRRKDKTRLNLDVLKTIKDESKKGN